MSDIASGRVKFLQKEIYKAIDKANELGISKHLFGDLLKDQGIKQGYVEHLKKLGKR